MHGNEQVTRNHNWFENEIFNYNVKTTQVHFSQYLRTLQMIEMKKMHRQG